MELYCGLTNREFRVAMANPKTGGVDLDEILSKIDKDTLLLSVMSASNISGYIFDIETIVREARKINPDIISFPMPCSMHLTACWMWNSAASTA